MVAKYGDNSASSQYATAIYTNLTALSLNVATMPVEGQMLQPLRREFYINDFVKQFDATTVYFTGDILLNGDHYFRVTSGGTSGAGVTWNVNIGDTVTSGTITAVRIEDPQIPRRIFSLADAVAQYEVDLITPVPSLRELIEIETGEPIDADAVTYNFDLISDVIGDESFNQQLHVNPALKMGVAALSARSNDGLYLGFQAMQKSEDEPQVFVRSRPDFRSGSSLLALSGDGLKIFTGAPRVGSETELFRSFAVTKDVVVLPRPSSIVEQIADEDDGSDSGSTGSGTTTDPPPPRKERPSRFPSGTVVYVNQRSGLPMKRNADSQSGTVYHMPYATKLTVIGSSKKEDGIEWFPVRDQQTRYGYADGKHLTKTKLSPPSGGGTGGGNNGGGTGGGTGGGSSSGCRYEGRTATCVSDGNTCQCYYTVMICGTAPEQLVPGTYVVLPGTCAGPYVPGEGAGTPPPSPPPTEGERGKR